MSHRTTRQSLAHLGWAPALLALVACGAGGDSTPPPAPPPGSSTPASAPTVSGFSPAAGKAGDTVTVSGAHFTGATAVSFNGVDAPIFSVQNDTTLTVVVPTGASSGAIQVTAPGGKAASSSPFTVTAAPLGTLRSLWPTAGAPGDRVTLYGEGLQDATQVLFNGASATFDILGDGQLVATVPAGATSGPLRVQTPAGALDSAQAFRVASAAPTQITDVVPAHARTGDKVRIKGQGLSSVTAVFFAPQWQNAKAAFTILSDTEIEAEVPGQAQSGDLLAVSEKAPGGGAYSPAAFTVDAPAPQDAPVITSVSPAAAKPWEILTITGKNFRTATAIKVATSDPGSYWWIDSDTQIRCIMPTFGTQGPVTITNPAGAADSTSVTCLNLPYLYPQSDKDGASKPGDMPWISIWNHGGLQRMTFGGAPTTDLQEDGVSGSNWVKVKIPLDASSGRYSVTTTKGTAVSLDNYFIQPVIDDVAPLQGQPGTTLVVKGRNFQDLSGATVGGQPAPYRLVDPSQVEVIVPSGASGPVGLATMKGLAVTSAQSFTLAAPTLGAPVIADLRPAQAAPGARLVLVGRGLQGATEVRFNGATASFQALSDEQLLVTVPAGANVGAVTVTTPQGSAPSPAPFTPLAHAVHNLLFNGDFELGDTGWTGGIRQSHIESAFANKWNPLPRSGRYLLWTGGWGREGDGFRGTTFDAPTSEPLTLPADAAKTELRFWLSMESLENQGKARDFFDVNLVDATDPTKVLKGGALLTLSNLSGPQDYQLHEYVLDLSAFKGRSFRVQFQSREDLALPTTWWIDDAQVLVTDAPSAPSPAVTNFSPSAGFPDETEVTLTGSNLTGLRGLLFNGHAAPFTQTGLTEVKAIVPADATSGPLTLVTAEGAVASPSAFTVKYHAPTVSAMTPSQGPAGATVFVLGANFKNMRSVTVNGVSAAFSVESPNHLTFIVPAGATTGPVILTGAGGSAGAGTFKVDGSLSPVDLFIAKAQLSQATQREDGSLPLVKDRRALLRVFVQANTANTLLPKARARFYQGATLVHEAMIDPPAGLAGTPVQVAQGDFGKTWNAVVPAQVLQPGLSLQVELDPDHQVAEADPSDNLWPGVAPAPLEVKDTHPFRITFVPLSITYKGTAYTSDVSDANVDTFLPMFSRIWPVPEAIDRKVHAVYTTTNVPMADYSSGWESVLDELAALQKVERVADRYYYGVYRSYYGTAGGSGMAWLGKPQSMGVDWDMKSNGFTFTWRAGTVAHEVGHSLSRPHSPGCNAGSPDPAYPYPGAALGTWGFDPFAAAGDTQVYDPAKNFDVMAYCGYTWVSDYCVGKVMDFRLNGDSTVPAAPAAGPTDCLLVWGSIQDGVLTLRPSFQVKALPDDLNGEGSYEAELLGTGGAILGRLRFEPSHSDHGRGTRGFALAIPLNRLGLAGPGALTQQLTGLRIVRNGETLARRDRERPEPRAMAAASEPTLTRLAPGRVRLQWDAAQHPMALVRNTKGEVLSFAKDGQVDLVTTDAEVDVTFSDGLLSQTQRLQAR